MYYPQAQSDARMFRLHSPDGRGQSRMKLMTKSAVALLATTAIATAGGVERSNQSMSILFEEGTYAELSFSHVRADVSGVSSATTFSSGDVATDYNNYALRYRQDITDNLSFALILENHIGADVTYDSGTGYPLAGAQAELPANSLTGILRYEFPSSFSVYGGVRVAQASGEVMLPLPPPAPAPYTLSTNTDTAVGYLVGVAYEIPEIALRVALTYNSAMTPTNCPFDRIRGIGPFSGMSTFRDDDPSIHQCWRRNRASPKTRFCSAQSVGWIGASLTSRPPVTPYHCLWSPVPPWCHYDNDTMSPTRLAWAAGSTTNGRWCRVPGATKAEAQHHRLEPGPHRWPQRHRAWAPAIPMPNGMEISGGVQYSIVGQYGDPARSRCWTVLPTTDTIAAGLTIGMKLLIQAKFGANRDQPRAGRSPPRGFSCPRGPATAGFGSSGTVPGGRVDAHGTLLTLTPRSWIRHPGPSGASSGAGRFWPSNWRLVELPVLTHRRPPRFLGHPGPLGLILLWTRLHRAATRGWRIWAALSGHGRYLNNADPLHA